MGDVVDLNGRSLGCAPPGQRPDGRPRRTDTSSLRVGSRRCTPRASSSVSGPASPSHRSCEFRHRQTAVEPMPTNGDRGPAFHRDQPELFPEFGFQANRGLASAELNVMYVLLHVGY